MKSARVLSTIAVSRELPFYVDVKSFSKNHTKITDVTTNNNFTSFFQVVKQCCATDGVEANYIKEEILPEFFKNFWTHRMALDRRNYRQVS